MEWVNMKQLFQEMLTHFGFLHLVPLVQKMLFAWKYHDSIATLLYKPTFVFKNFAFADLLDSSIPCLCKTTKRLRRFLDPMTTQEATNLTAPDVHVRTVSCDLLQHTELRKAVTMGLNHVPLKPTAIGICISTILDAFEQVASILSLDSNDFPLTEAKEWVRVTSLARLKKAQNMNKFGF